MVGPSLLFGGRAVAAALDRTLVQQVDIATMVAAHDQDLASLDDDGLRLLADRLRPQLVARGFAADVVAHCFALIRETTGRKLGMRHRPVQLIGGFAMIHGRLAEMRTGEGKTITALLPAATAALAGMPVHVVTVNDYLAERDASQLRPVFEALGLSVGLAVNGQEQGPNGVRPMSAMCCMPATRNWCSIICATATPSAGPLRRGSGPAASVARPTGRIR